MGFTDLLGGSTVGVTDVLDIILLMKFSVSCLVFRTGCST